MPVPLCNYHTHTWRCKHAAGCESEYIENAIQAGYEAWALPTTWPGPEHFVSPVRMTAGQLEEYARTVRELEARYSGRIRIHLGAECEYYPEHHPWLLAQRDRLGLEYLILGVHYPPCEEGHRPFAEATTPRELEQYTELCIAGMETGDFRFLCHPDVPLKTYPRFDEHARRMSERICDAAARLGIPLEYNLLGVELRGAVPGGHGYTSHRFWRIAARRGCTAVIASDAHNPRGLGSAVPLLHARKKLLKMGIKVLDTLPGLGEPQGQRQNL